MGLQVLPRDRVAFLLVRKIQDDGPSDKSFQADLIQCAAALDEMGRGIQVGAHVIAEPYGLDGISVFFDGSGFPDFRRRLSRPHRHVFRDVIGQINIDFH